MNRFNIKTEMITTKNADDIFGLWKSQFSKFCSESIIYDYWVNNTDDIKNYINQKIFNREVIVAKENRKIVGYFAYDIFDYHGSKSAFIPFTGNASISDRYYIYTSLYRDIAEKWVSEGILNHYISICVDDIEIKDTLFDLGFGSYVIDAFSTLSEIPYCQSSIIISKATIADAEALYEIDKEDNKYYSLSPIFFKKEEMDSFDEFKNSLKTTDILIAKDKEDIVGFMNVGIHTNDDIYYMRGKGFGGIGAYIKSEYRGMNIGNRLLSAAAEYYSAKLCPLIHVDWETANLYGNRFWRKYFKPTIITLKRTVHADMLSGI